MNYASFLNVLSWCQGYVLKCTNSHKSVKNKQAAKLPALFVLSPRARTSSFFVVVHLSRGALAVAPWVSQQLANFLTMSAAEPHRAAPRTSGRVVPSVRELGPWLSFCRPERFGGSAVGQTPARSLGESSLSCTVRRLVQSPHFTHEQMDAPGVWGRAGSGLWPPASESGGFFSSVGAGPAL